MPHLGHRRAVGCVELANAQVVQQLQTLRAIDGSDHPASIPSMTTVAQAQAHQGSGRILNDRGLMSHRERHLPSPSADRYRSTPNLTASTIDGLRRGPGPHGHQDIKAGRGSATHLPNRHRSARCRSSSNVNTNQECAFTTNLAAPAMTSSSRRSSLIAMSVEGHHHLVLHPFKTSDWAKRLPL